jgi:sarcosine oxidase delta subunit
MQAALFSKQILCPYCGERIEMNIENTGEAQQYIEDCEVCCQPINIHIVVTENQRVQVNAFTDNEV